MRYSSLHPNEFKKSILDRLIEIEQTILPLFQFIKSGVFMRDKESEIYAGRLAYTKELRRFVYDSSVFNEILLQDTLKEKFFRVFGYKYNLDFTLYPHAWIRDLALKDFVIGKNVYLADGIVLGTNQVTPCQKRLKVGPIKIGNDTIFDQCCKIGLRTIIGEHCVIGVSCHIGLKTYIGNNVKISPLSSVGHMVTINDNVIIGTSCIIGSFSVVEEGAVIADYTQVPQHSMLSKNGKITPL